MKRLGLKYISSTGANFPAVNSGTWNLATNFKGNFNRILTESGIDPEDDESVALYLRFTESGMLLCAARRYFPVSEPMAHFQTLWMFVPDSLIISRESLSKAVRELTGIFEHPEAFTSMEAFEDILPSIFLQDFEEEHSGEPEPTEVEKAAEEAGKRLEREIFEAFAGMGKDKEKEKNEQPRKKMTGERIGYVGYESVEELEIILSAGFIPQYSNFGLIYLTDYPVRVESLLPGLFHPDILLHRQLERDRQREEEEKRREEEETGEQEDSELTGEEEGDIDTGEQENSELTWEEGGDEETGEQENSNTMGEEEVVQTGEQEIDILTGEEVGNVETGEQETSREGEDSHRKTWRKNFSKHSFWAGFIAASVLYLLIYIVVQVCQSL